MYENFKELVDFYDEFQSKLFNYGKEVEIINTELKKYSAKMICDVGCGTGTHLIELAKMGYECVGIDYNIEMLRKAEEKAKREGVSIKFIEADIRDAKLLKDRYGKFDAVLWIRNTSSSVNEMKLALKTQYNLLKNGGIIIFDVLQNREDDCTNEFLNMDVITKEEAIVVRLNNFKISKQQVLYDSVYFIQAKGLPRIAVNYLLLPLINLDDIQRILKGMGFRYKSTIYEYIGIPGTKSTMILAGK